jgi:hypothetical protein
VADPTKFPCNWSGRGACKKKKFKPFQWWRAETEVQAAARALAENQIKDYISALVAPKKTEA